MFRRKQPQQVGHQRDIKNGHHANMERTAQVSGFAVYFLEEIFELPKDGAGVFLKNLTGRGEQDAFSAALKERDAQARFQIPHLLGYARLGNAEPVRSATETAGLGHGEEIAQMAEFQRIVRHGSRSFCI
jgi:hypothetical protein